MRVQPAHQNNHVRRTIFKGYMTSEERHAARRLRREKRREEKRRQFKAPFDSFTVMTDMDNLLDAARQSRKGVGEKASVQKYFMNLIGNTAGSRRKLLCGEDVRQGFIEFDLHERGKARHIKSMHFKERVIQRCICDRALVPVLKRPLVYDNGASLKDKGIHFAMFRLRDYLRRYYRQHGNWDGYVLTVDFSKYFDNIRHEPVRELLERSFDDPQLRELAWSFVTAFGDVSIGIGSQVSQILAVAYPNAADHYIKEVCRIGASMRYMDDTIMISDSREKLLEAFDGAKKIWDRLGIRINEKKTQIIPMKRFSFIKVRYQCMPGGRVVMKPCRKSYTRMRRKLRKFRPFLERGEMTIAQILASYESWYGYQKHLDAHRSMRRMDKYFHELYDVWPTHGRRH